jgi:serine protease AprX
MASRFGVKSQEVRSSALWGRGGRTKAALIAFVVLALAVPASSTAGSGKSSGALVPATLLAQATASPLQTFHVIVQGSKGNSSKTVASDVQSTTKNGKLKRKFLSISGVSADLTGADLLKLAKNPHVLAITPDTPVKAMDYQDSTMWAASADVAPLWSNVDPYTGADLGPAPQAPAVAVVDSGVDPSKAADFGGRLVASINMSSLSPGATGDDEGHGTMVAGVLAGSAAGYPGAAPNAPIVSLRTADANGMSLESDVIAAADWILANRQTYNIRVANFSLAGASPTSFRFDPLDKAVEALWFSGVVVVAAAGNHGSESGPVDMSLAPGNDPFVITVGALDQHSTADPYDDTVPWWSAYGNTMDGFKKPDMAAPGRYMIAAVPMSSTLATTAPERVVGPGYMWMSGTSFATPVVAGAAAQILARHPEWTPDEVKGALMLTSAYLWNAPGSGVGEIDAAAAASLPFTPPNPNENFYAFVHPDATTGVPAFDQASWVEAVKANGGWSSASWSEASWAEASWSEASWAEASWNEASWSENVGSQMAALASWTEGTMEP